MRDLRVVRNLCDVYALRDLHDLRDVRVVRNLCDVCTLRDLRDFFSIFPPKRVDTDGGGAFTAPAPPAGDAGAKNGNDCTDGGGAFTAPAPPAGDAGAKNDNDGTDGGGAFIAPAPPAGSGVVGGSNVSIYSASNIDCWPLSLRVAKKSSFVIRLSLSISDLCPAANNSRVLDAAVEMSPVNRAIVF